jgi:lycopene cyclase domain-containing protein
MTYFGVLLTFIVPPLLALGVLVPLDFWRWLFKKGPKPDLLPYQAVLLLTVIAVIYTTPWDNYLVATGVWWYDPDLVIGITLGWVPIEEYTFFILQTLLTGLWTVWVLRKFRAAPFRSNPRLRLISSLAIGILWIASCGLWLSGWKPGIYLSLILAWALLPVLLQVAFGADILFNHRKALLAAIAVPTLYLWIIDGLAITSGTWLIDPLQTTGIKLNSLPIEEMLFFLVTNILIAFGIILVLSPESLERLPLVTLQPRHGLPVRLVSRKKREIPPSTGINSG